MKARFEEIFTWLTHQLPFSETVVRTVGWLFILSAFAFFGYSTKKKDPMKDTVVPAGVLIALSGVFFAQARDLADTRQKSSAFYLESAIKAFQEAKELLEDGNNDRATWIAAGRALEHAKQLSAGVTVDAHRYVLEFNSLRYRRFFGQHLQSKPAPFFYGVSQFENLDVTEAAKLSTSGDDKLISANRKLSEKSIHAVWETAQWPENYKDPLGRKFTKAEMGKLMVLYDGLHEFLEHEDDFASAGGKLFPRKGHEKRA
jgi:hypothetical protein